MLNEYQIAAMKIGLTRAEVEDPVHNWLCVQISRSTLEYIESRPESMSASQAFEQIKGLQYSQIDAMKIGLTRADLEDPVHNWLCGQISSATLKYIESRPESMSASQAFEQIKGLQYSQIDAMKIGLTRAEVEDPVHNWLCGQISSATLKYIESRPESMSASQAFEQIKGLQYSQIDAMKIGLTRAEVEDPVHNWLCAQISRSTLEYIESRPESMKARQAFENIKGLDWHKINALIELQNRAIAELELEPIQVYIKGITQEQFDAIKGGQNYEKAMPGSHQAMRELEESKEKDQAYVKGAVLGALRNSEFFSKLPDEVALKIGDYLSLEDGGKLAQVNKSASASAKAELSHAEGVIARRNAAIEKGPEGQSR